MRTALITGGAGGLGLATAKRLAQDGIRIALADLAGAEAAAEGMGKGYTLDVTDPGAIRDVVGRITDDFGGADILVNSAGILPRVNGKNPTVADMPLDIWDRTLAVNLTAPMLMAQACIPLMRKAGWGRIITISSRSGRMRTFGNAHYSAPAASHTVN